MKSDVKGRGRWPEQSQGRHLGQQESFRAAVAALANKHQHNESTTDLPQMSQGDKNNTDTTQETDHEDTGNMAPFPFSVCLDSCMKQETDEDDKTESVSMLHECHRKCLANPHMYGRDDDEDNGNDEGHKQNNNNNSLISLLSASMSADLIVGW